jgi:hypothetical protein
MANTNKSEYNKNISSSISTPLELTLVFTLLRLLATARMATVLLFLFCLPLFSAEVILKTGEVFICDLISENTYQIKVNWKGKEYVIPRQDIASVDLKKTGKHISYKYLNFKLNDGSQIKGAIADENNESYTLKTDVGFLTIDKNKIKSSDPREEPKLAESYESGWVPEKLLIGITGTGLSNSAPINSNHPTSYGGGIFVEPISLQIFSRFQFGFRSEYLVSDGSGYPYVCLACSVTGRYDFFNNFAYLKYNWKKSELLDFYGSIGGGASYVRYRLGDITLASLNPAATAEIGWQGIKFGRFFVRVSLRAIGIQEKNISLGMGGMEISVGRGF